MSKLTFFNKKTLFLMLILLLALLYSGLVFKVDIKEGNESHSDSIDTVHDHLNDLTAENSGLKSTGLYLGNVELKRDDTKLLSLGVAAADLPEDAQIPTQEV